MRPAPVHQRLILSLLAALVAVLVAALARAGILAITLRRPARRKDPS